MTVTCRQQQATARMTAIAGTQAAAGMRATRGPPTQYGRRQKQTLEKVVKPTTACWEANYSRDIFNKRDDSSSIDNRKIVHGTQQQQARQNKQESQQQEISQDHMQQGCHAATSGAVAEAVFTTPKLLTVG
jgi:hypothetical protein